MSMGIRVTKTDDSSTIGREKNKTKLPYEEECVDTVRCIGHNLIQKYSLSQRFAILKFTRVQRIK